MSTKYNVDKKYQGKKTRKKHSIQEYKYRIKCHIPLVESPSTSKRYLYYAYKYTYHTFPKYSYIQPQIICTIFRYIFLCTFT